MPNLRELACLPILVWISAFLVWMAFTMGVIARGKISGCPRCGAARTRDSARRKLDFLLLSFVSPRRCESCGRRFFTLVSVNYPALWKNTSSVHGEVLQSSGVRAASSRGGTGAA